MRRHDKKNILNNANILAEQRYLQTKGLIKESEFGDNSQLQGPTIGPQKTGEDIQELVSSILNDINNRFDGSDTTSLFGYIDDIVKKTSDNNLIRKEIYNGLGSALQKSDNQNLRNVGISLIKTYDE